MHEQSLRGRIGLGRRIYRQRKLKVRAEIRAEVIEASDAPPELSVQGLPGHESCLWQGMEPVCQPAVDIQRQAVVREASDGSLLDWNGMAPKLVVERLR